MLHQRAPRDPGRDSERFYEQTVELKDHRKFARLQDLAMHLGLWDGHRVQFNVRGLLSILLVIWILFGFLYLSRGSSNDMPETNPPYAPSKVEYMDESGEDEDEVSSGLPPAPHVEGSDLKDQESNPVVKKKAEKKEKVMDGDKVSIMRQRAVLLARKSFSAEIDELKARVEKLVHGNSKDITDAKLLGLQQEITHMADEWEHNMLAIQKIHRKDRAKYHKMWNLLARQYYRVASSLYQVLNRRSLHNCKGKIPLLFLNSHRYVARYWEKARLRGIKLPHALLHIGSHADMNHFDRPGAILQALEALRPMEPKEESEPLPAKSATSPHLKVLGDEVGSENAGTLGPLLFNFKQVSWLKPKWIGTPVPVRMPLTVGRGVIGTPTPEQQEDDIALICFLFKPRKELYRRRFMTKAFQSGMMGTFFDGLRENDLKEDDMPAPYSTCHHNTKNRSPSDRFKFGMEHDFDFTMATWGTNVPSSLPKKVKKHAHKSEQAKKHSQPDRKMKISHLPARGERDDIETETILEVVKNIPDDSFVLDLDLDMIVTSSAGEKGLVDLQSSPGFHKTAFKLCKDVLLDAKNYGEYQKNVGTEADPALADFGRKDPEKMCKFILSGHTDHIKALRQNLLTDLSEHLPIQIVNKRIDELLEFLEILKIEHNKVPTVITLSDSTDLLPFHRRKDEHNTQGGDQMPGYLAQYVHERIRAGLDHLYELS